MKKLLLTAGICLSALFFAQAQQAASTAPATTDQQIEKMMTNLTTTCHLTSDQVTKAKPIITEFVNAIAANRQKFGTDKDKLKEANEASKKVRDSKLNAILNADQQKQLAGKEAQVQAAKQQKKAKPAAASENK